MASHFYKEFKLKCCRICGKPKQLEDFPKTKKSLDGRDTQCKSCKNSGSRKHYDLNSARIKEQQRIYYANNKDVRSKSVTEYQHQQPNKVKAHRAVNDAIRYGKLKSLPCQNCGLTVGIRAHHDDYLKPLEVRWLCPKHHAEWHRLNGEALNG